jgi:hypothetical protein
VYHYNDQRNTPEHDINYDRSFVLPPTPNISSTFDLQSRWKLGFAKIRKVIYSILILFYFILFGGGKRGFFLAPSDRHDAVYDLCHDKRA